MFYWALPADVSSNPTVSQQALQSFPVTVYQPWCPAPALINRLAPVESQESCGADLQRQAKRALQVYSKQTLESPETAESALDSWWCLPNIPFLAVILDYEISPRLLPHSPTTWWSLGSQVRKILLRRASWTISSFFVAFRPFDCLWFCASIEHQKSRDHADNCKRVEYVVIKTTSMHVHIFKPPGYNLQNIQVWFVRIIEPRGINQN